MLLFSKKPKTIFQTISTDLIESLKTPPDLSFVCGGGKMVHTHKILLATFSPFLRSTLASLEPANSSKSVVLSMPEASGSALEQVIQILCKPWSKEELTLSMDEVTVFQVLGIPVGISVSKELRTTLKESSQYPDLQASKEVNQEETAVALEETLGIPKKITLDVLDAGCDTYLKEYIMEKMPKCKHCDTIFRDSTLESIEEITIHLGEVHFEMDLQVEQMRRFLTGSNKCEECAYEFKSDYVQKEHIMLKHPWLLLKTSVEEIISMDHDEASDLEEDSNFDKTVEEATLSLLTKEFDGNEPKVPPTQSSCGNDALLKMEEFILSLNKASSKKESMKSAYLESANDVQTQNKATLIPNLLNAGSLSPSPRTVAKCPKCSQKWTYTSESRMSDLKSRIKSHVVDLHFGNELKLLLQKSFVGNDCQLCGETFKTEDIQKKHLRKVHNALESDVMSIVELLLGNDMNRKDPPKKKRKGSPGAFFSNPRSPKIPTYRSEVNSSKTNINYLLDSSSNDFINDNLESDLSLKVNESPVDLVDDRAALEREVCKEIQQNIEFSDSEDEN